MSTTHNRIFVNKTLAIKRSDSFSAANALFGRSARLPFRYSQLAYGLSVCVLAQFAVQPAVAADNNRLPAEIRENLSADELASLNEILIEQGDEDAAAESASALNHEQLEEALIALKLKRAVEQGIIDPDVLADYQRETLSVPSSPTGSPNSSINTNNLTNNLGTPSQTTGNGSINNPDYNNVANTNNGKDFDERFTNNKNNVATAIDFSSNQSLSSPAELERTLAEISAEVDTNFDKPMAALDSNQAPLGFDATIDDVASLNPSNRETLGLVDNDNTGADDILITTSQPKTGAQSQTTIDASDLNSKDVSLTDRVEVDDLDNQTLANIGKVDESVEQADTEITDDVVAQVQENNDADSGINPDDYLPKYDRNANGGFDEQDALVQNDADDDVSDEIKPGFFKGVYNRLFNDGVAALPRIKAHIYLQDEDSINSEQPKLRKADSDTQPANNIKAAMENITVEAISDFTAAMPKLRQEALNAAQAVGYYDVKLRFQRASKDEVDVIVERLGEPVKVTSRIVDIRGEGAELKEFQKIAQSSPPETGDVFNHGVYKTAKNDIEIVKYQYGFFDGEWLNKSVDVILPDNTADVDLIYDTGPRYKFDEVVFFTLDEESGKLTTDPDKLPLNPKLLHQLHDFKAGDDFYGPLVTKFTNDLSATRYFNAVNIEAIRPSNSRSNSTLAFENDDDSETTLDLGLPPEKGNTSESAIAGALGVDKPKIPSSEAGTETNINTEANRDGEDGVNAEQGKLLEELQPIEYTVDEETTDKLADIKAKAMRLSRLPDDRVLDATDDTEAKNILGKISNAISGAVKKVLPDDEDIFADSDALPEDLSETFLASRKTPEEVAESKEVPLYVFVIANKPKDVDLGVGYGTDTGVRAVARLEHNLINKEGYQAGVTVGASSINKSINVHASRPWKHPLNDILTGNVSYEQEQINQGEGNLDLETNTVKAGVARKIRNESGWNRSYSLRYRLDDLESGVKGPDRENLPEPFNREGARFEQEALLLGYQLDKTNTDNITNPSKGWRQYYSVEFGSEEVLSDTNMAIARAGVSGLYSFGEMNKHQIVASLDGGYIWADDFESVPYKLRFFVGGDRSIRGYDYNSLSAIEKGYLVGGQVLALGSTEYNYEFKPGLRGAMFADFGNAYDKNFEAETKLGVGFGVRWASPVGMVRLDLAAGVLEDSIPVRLHLFVGSPLQ